MPDRTGNLMPRKKKKADATEPVARKQYNLGFTPAMAARIDDTAEALGVEPSHLLRMIVNRGLPRYEEEAAENREAAARAAARRQSRK